METRKIKLGYVLNIVNDQALPAVVKLQVLKTMIRRAQKEPELQDDLKTLQFELEMLCEEELALKPPTSPPTPEPSPADQTPRTPDSPVPLVNRRFQAGPPNAVSAAQDKDSGMLIEEIKETTETMKSSFLRMNDHMAKDVKIFDKAKEAQIRNDDATALANKKTSAFLSSSRVGFIEMLVQIMVAFVLGILALYLV